MTFPWISAAPSAGRRCAFWSPQAPPATALPPPLLVFPGLSPTPSCLTWAPMGAGCAWWCLKSSREGYPGTSLVETHLDLKLRVSRAVENEVLPPRALKGALGRHYLWGLTPWSLISCPEVYLQGARTGLKTQSLARELLGSAWKLTQLVVTPSQACACSPLRGAADGGRDGTKPSP